MSGGPAIAETKSDSRGDGEAPVLPSFVPVNKVVVTMASQGRVRAMLVVDGAIEMSADDAVRAKALTPKLVDAWLTTLTGMANRGNFAEGRLDLDLMRRQLAEASDKVLGIHVGGVNLTQAILQPVR